VFKKLIFLAFVVVGGALPFAGSSPGARTADALCFGSAATITGSGTIVGTDANDVIIGGDGGDTIQGKGGDDTICGGPGNDSIGGGPGDDQLDGGAGNDIVQGGPGNDTVLGGEGDDTIQGGADTDTCDGGSGANTIVTSGFEGCETATGATPPTTIPTEDKHFAIKATLTVGHVVPHPKGTRGATGRFTGTLTPTGTGSTLVWRLTFAKLTGPALRAEVRTGLSGRTGPVLVVLCAPCRSGDHGTLDVDGQPARRALLSGETYVNVQTTRNPRGEIRGQIPKVSGS
jgi:Ca2+-binding RTX toxin-like protein